MAECEAFSLRSRQTCAARRIVTAARPDSVVAFRPLFRPFFSDVRAGGDLRLDGGLCQLRTSYAANGLSKPFKVKLTKCFYLHRLVNRGQHARGDHNLASPRLIAKPRCKIYDATDRCVLPTLLEANLSHSRKAGGDPNSKSKFVALASPLRPQFVHSFPHVQRQPDGTLGVIDTWNWIVEHNHDPVAEKSFQRALVTEDEFSQVLVVITQDRHDLFGFGCLGKVGKATQIAEQDRDLLSMTGQHRIG